MNLTPREKLIDLQKNLNDFDKAKGYSELINIILTNSLLIKESDFNTIGRLVGYGLKREKELTETYSAMIKLFKKTLTLIEKESVRKELIAKIIEIDTSLNTEQNKTLDDYIKNPNLEQKFNNLFSPEL